MHALGTNANLGQARWGWKAVGLLVVVDLVSRIALSTIAFNYDISLKFGHSILYLAIIVFALICFARPLYLLVRLRPDPIKQMKADLHRHWSWIFSTIASFFLIADVMGLASQFKSMIPEIVPFYADPFLANLDLMLLGTDAWRLTHAIFGGTATHLISDIYTLWFFVNVGLAMFISFDKASTFKLQAALTFQLTWFLLGGLFALAASSVGPCFYAEFYGSDRFIPLMEALPDDLRQRKAMAYLLSTQGENAFANGISAMPSLHVGIAFLAALVTQARFKQLWLKSVMWFNLVVTYVGSIHIGWHYATDGIASVVGVLVIWPICGRIAMWATAENRPSPELSLARAFDHNNF